MKKTSLLKTIGCLVLMGCIVNARAQFEASPYDGSSTRRSIWDKEPEPKPATTPYGVAASATPMGATQSNAVMDPPSFDPIITDGVPIDGGLSLLMAAGALYGARRTYKMRKSLNKKHRTIK